MNRFNLKAFDMQKYKIDNLENMKPIISQLANDVKIKFPLSEEKFFDIRLVLSELVMNAFKHSKSDEFVDIFLNNDYSDSEIKITVEDYGCGFDFDNVCEKTGRPKYLQQRRKGYQAGKRTLRECYLQRNGEQRFHRHKGLNPFWFCSIFSNLNNN